jgi:hypothetical protein
VDGLNNPGRWFEKKLAALDRVQVRGLPVFVWMRRWSTALVNWLNNIFAWSRMKWVAIARRRPRNPPVDPQ